jgi:hypothetical protein
VNRVPAKLAVLLLHQEADARQAAGDLAGAKQLRITPGALRNWVWRGHITRGPGGYDLGEILGYLERRATTGHDRSARPVDSRSIEV